MLLVLRIADRLQKIVKTWYASTVLGRCVSFARQTRGVRAPWFRCQAFLDHDLMLPAIPEVIGVHGLCSRPAQHVEQSCGPFAGGARSPKDLLHRIGCSEPLLSDTELMHMAVFPTHGQL